MPNNYIFVSSTFRVGFVLTNGDAITSINVHSSEKMLTCRSSIWLSIGRGGVGGGGGRWADCRLDVTGLKWATKAHFHWTPVLCATAASVSLSSEPLGLCDSQGQRQSCFSTDKSENKRWICYLENGFTGLSS